jgi:hypothetical protein
MRNRAMLLLLAAISWGCGGKSAADYQKEAQAALDGKDNPKAVAIVTEALQKDAVRGDTAAAWRLEQIRLEALARSAKGAEAKAELDRLAAAYPKQVNASLYRSLADKAKAAGDVPGAIDIPRRDQRFPADHAAPVEAVDAPSRRAGSIPRRSSIEGPRLPLKENHGEHPDPESSTTPTPTGRADGSHRRRHGNQGRRRPERADSGLTTIVGNIDDNYAATARADGFAVHPIAEACRKPTSSFARPRRGDARGVRGSSTRTSGPGPTLLGPPIVS